MAAKRLRIRVEEFGLGLPPKVFSIRRGETIYSLNLLPVGGFVRLTGEEAVEKTKDPRSFVNKKPLERAAVLLSGVFMNFLLATIVISVIFTQGVFVTVDRVHVEGVAPSSPAETAGLKQGDILVSINDQKILRNEDLKSYAAMHLGEEVRIKVLRVGAGKELEFTAVPRKEYPKGEGPLGVAISNLEIKKYPWYKAPFLGVVETVNLSGKMISGLFSMIFNLITKSEVPRDVAGPIGIYNVTDQAVSKGYIAVLQLLGFLSLNLGVVNILPFPALDGGRFMFVLVEMIFGRRIVPRFERFAHTFGVIVLLFLIVLVSISDIARIVSR